MEKKLKELQEFSLKPSDQVWKEIELNLDNQRKKRIVGWWWSAPILFSILGVGFLLINKNINQQNGVLQNKLIDNSKLEISKSDDINSKTETKLNHKYLGEILNEVEPKIILINKETGRKKINLSDNIIVKKNLLNKKRAVEKFSDLLTEININKKATENSVVNNLEEEKKTIKTDGSIEKNSNTIKNDNHLIIEKIDSTEQKINKETTSKNEIEIETVKEALPNIKKATKKLNWSLAIGGGLNYISRNNIFGQDETIKTLNTLSTPVSTGATSNTNTKLSLPKTGFHFSVGVNLDYTISKKLSLQTGIKYRYLENELGLTADTIQVNPTYYYLGNQIKYINYSNQFEIPIAINYCINPLSNTKISLIGGLNLTYIFKDNWLNLYDNISRYQPSVNQNHRFLFGLQTGVSFNFNSKFSLNLIALKNLSSVQKNSSKYYWQQLDFQLNIPFKSLKK